MANIYVNHTGSSTPPYNTEAKAATNIQVTLDAAVSGDMVLIKADQDYVMNGTDQQAAQFDVDTSDNITIRGYYATVGDQDYGGAYYKDSVHGWVVINANNGAFNVFSAGNKNKLRWHNLKTINVSTSKISFDLTPTSEETGYMIQNCWTTGGQRAIVCDNLNNPIMLDCLFTGAYSTHPTLGNLIQIALTCYYGSIIENCNFAHTNVTRSIYYANATENILAHNVFNIAGTVTSVVDVINGYLVNNIIYEGTGGNITDSIKIESGGQNAIIYNNIIVGCTTSINDLATVNFGGWNCFYNNGSNWTLRNGDIVADPQFMNAPNGDFRLKPTSPCLNTGKPTLGGGYTSMGVWQRKSLLRHK
jgi:hypothetical protein